MASPALFVRLSKVALVGSLFTMQRLFSMFPTGMAGIALVLLRLSVAVMLLMLGYPRGGTTSSVWAFAGLAVLAVFFFLGALTPVLCVVVFGIEIAAIFLLKNVDTIHMLFSIVDTAALGLLGPGGYSLDARIFGRRRVILSTDDLADLP
jgi:hypothetical protein